MAVEVRMCFRCSTWAQPWVITALTVHLLRVEIRIALRPVRHGGQRSNTRDLQHYSSRRLRSSAVRQLYARAAKVAIKCASRPQHERSALPAPPRLSAEGATHREPPPLPHRTCRLLVEQRCGSVKICLLRGSFHRLSRSNARDFARPGRIGLVVEVAHEGDGT